MENYLEGGNKKQEEIRNFSINRNKKGFQENNKETDNHIKNLLYDIELLETVGNGSESKVFKGLIKGSNKNVSVKSIFTKKGHSKNTNEINISNKLKNQNIINLYGVKDLKDEKIDYLMIMEHGSQGNLKIFKKKVLKRDYLSESFLCYVTYQILNALKYCHMNKVAHFDIKPQNIVIDDYINVKLIDFSIALDYREQYLNNKKIDLDYRGTPLFMAPEIISSKTIKAKDLNKVDLFSLGVTLYHEAFGVYPFGLTHEDSKKKEIIYQKIMGGLKIDNTDFEFSNHFIDFLKKLLETDINKRININEALNHYWVQGAIILNKEKEKIYNASSFLSYLITDHFKSFDDYMKKE